MTVAGRVCGDVAGMRGKGGAVLAGPQAKVCSWAANLPVVSVMVQIVPRKPSDFFRPNGCNGRVSQ
jgi:hypothetical protein